MKKEKGMALITLIVTIIVMLIIAGVVIYSAVSEDGIISKANQAESALSLAKVKEEAELLKTASDLEMKSNNENNVAVVQEYKEKLAAKLGGRIEGNKVIVNDEYAVIVKNTDLDIEIIEDNFLDKDSLLSQTCEITEDNQLKVTMSIMDREELRSKLIDQATKEIKNTSLATKESEVVKYYASENDLYKDAITIDELVIKGLEANFKDKSYNTLEEWVVDADVLAYANNIGITELTINHLYSYVLLESTEPMDKETIINNIYASFLLNDKTLSELCNRAHGQLVIHLKKNGKIIATQKDQYVYGRDGVPYFIDILNTNNNELEGEYELSIKTYLSTGTPPQVTLSTEKIIINK